MQRCSLCWFLQQLTGPVFSYAGSLSTLLRDTLHWCLEGLVMESVAGGDTVPCLGHTQWVTFHSVKDISHLLSQDSGVLLPSCSWMESIGVLMTE